MQPVPQVPTPALHKALTKAIGTCNNLLPAIEYLEELAKVMPEIEQEVIALRMKHEHLDRIGRVGCKMIQSDVALDRGE